MAERKCQVKRMEDSKGMVVLRHSEFASKVVYTPDIFHETSGSKRTSEEGRTPCCPADNVLLL